MNKTILFLLVAAVMVYRAVAQNCSTCGDAGSHDLTEDEVTPTFSVSMGSARFGQSAGSLYFSSGLPDPALFTPAALQYNSSRPDVEVITNVDGSIRQV